MRLANPRHEAFCHEYRINGFNAKQAYKTVYKTKNDKTAEVNGDRLRSNAEVQARLAELAVEDKEKYGINIQEVVDSIKETRALAKSQSDFNASLKADDMLLKVSGGYATEKTKTEIQHLDKNGEPTDPFVIPLDLLPKPLNE
jgi:Terminase small subunit